MKHTSLETQYEMLQKNLEQKVQQLQDEKSSLTEEKGGLEQTLQSELEKERAGYRELDKQFNELNNQYDKDKALWEGQFAFLE